MEHVPHSPYLRALGGQRGALHPALRTYFAAAPRGQVAVGEGTFSRVGTPKRWLWPVLRWLQKYGVVHAGWHENVPFTVRNLSVASRAIGERTLHLPEGDWTMRGSAGSTVHGRVLDQIGEPVTVAVTFDVTVDGDALALRSRSVGVLSVHARKQGRDRPLACRHHGISGRRHRAGIRSPTSVDQLLDRDHLPPRRRPSDDRSRRRHRYRLLGRGGESLGARATGARPAVHSPSRSAHGDRAGRCRRARSAARAHMAGPGRHPDPWLVACHEDTTRGGHRTSAGRPRRAPAFQLDPRRRCVGRSPDADATLRVHPAQCKPQDAAQQGQQHDQQQPDEPRHVPYLGVVAADDVHRGEHHQSDGDQREQERHGLRVSRCGCAWLVVIPRRWLSARPGCSTRRSTTPGTR